MTDVQPPGVWNATWVRYVGKKGAVWPAGIDGLGHSPGVHHDWEVMCSVRTLLAESWLAAG